MTIYKYATRYGHVIIERVCKGMYKAYTDRISGTEPGDFEYCSGVWRKGSRWCVYDNNPYIAGTFKTLREWKQAVIAYYN